jgi:hypothetical protein
MNKQNGSKDVKKRNWILGKRKLLATLYVLEKNNVRRLGIVYIWGLEKRSPSQGDGGMDKAQR